MKVIIWMVTLLISSTGFARNNTLLAKDSLPVLKNKSVVSGFYNQVNVGVLGGSSSSGSFHIINGYRLNERWSAGVGLGIEEFYNRKYVPIHFEGNMNILKRNTTPWVSVMAGYELPFQNIGPNRGGFTAGGKVGFSYFIGTHIGITTSLGYRYAHFENTVNWWGWDSFVEITDVNRYEFRVGMIFK